MLDVVQKAYKALTPKEIVAYAPIQAILIIWKLPLISVLANPARTVISVLRHLWRLRRSPSRHSQLF